MPVYVPVAFRVEAYRLHSTHWTRMQRWPRPRVEIQKCELRREGTDREWTLDEMLRKGREGGGGTERWKDFSVCGCEVEVEAGKVGRVVGLELDFGLGLDVGMIDGIAFSQNSSRGRRRRRRRAVASLTSYPPSNYIQPDKRSTSPARPGPAQPSRDPTGTHQGPSRDPVEANPNLPSLHTNLQP